MNDHDSLAFLAWCFILTVGVFTWAFFRVADRLEALEAALRRERGADHE